MTGFIYLWYDRKHKRFYLGSHWGDEDDGYICSSSWMKQAYKKRPADFRRRVIARGLTTKKTLIDEEHRWLSMIDPSELKGNKYYNIVKSSKNPWWTDEDRKLTIGQKISRAKKGKRMSPDHIEKMAATKRGTKHSAETKQKMAESHLGHSGYWTGKSMSQEHKEKIRQGMIKARAKQKDENRDNS